MQQAELAIPSLPLPAGVPQGLRRPRLTMLLLVLVAAPVIGVAAALKPLLGLAAVAALAATLVLAQRPDLAVFTMVTVAPAAAGLQRGLLVPGLRVSEASIVGLGALVLVFSSRERRPAWTAVEWLLLAYALLTIAFGGLDMALRRASLEFEDIGTMLGPMQFVILLRAVVVAMGEERNRQRAVHFMLGAAAFVALVSLAQAANLGPTRSILTTLTGGSLYDKSLGLGVGRITGPFNIWHELAGFLMPSILVSLSLMIGAEDVRRRLRYGLVFSLTVLALISTAAAGVLIATSIGALYICWRRRVLYAALAFAVPVVVIALVAFGSILGNRAQQQYVTPSATAYRIPYAPQSVSYRYSLFRVQNAPALTGHWATGYGPDLPPQLALGNFPYSETAYVSLLFRGGFPLLFVFLALLGCLIVTARRCQRRARDELQWTLATTVLVVTVSYVLLQLIESYLLDSGPPHIFWAYVGLMLAGARASLSPSGSPGSGS
jgi:hypothetical protein